MKPPELFVFKDIDSNFSFCAKFSGLKCELGIFEKPLIVKPSDRTQSIFRRYYFSQRYKQKVYLGKIF